jgi:hypothetical protein
MFAGTPAENHPDSNLFLHEKWERLESKSAALNGFRLRTSEVTLTPDVLKYRLTETRKNKLDP